MTRVPRHPWYDDKPVELVPPATGGRIVIAGDWCGTEADIVNQRRIVGMVASWGSDARHPTDTTDTSIAALSIGDEDCPPPNAKSPATD